MSLAALGLSPDHPILVLLPWLGLLCALLLDVLISFRWTPELDLNIPTEIFVGDIINVTLTVRRPAPQLRIRVEWPDGVTGPAEATFTSKSNEQSQTRIKIRAVRRGAWTLAHIWLLWPSRLHLWEFAPRLQRNQTFRIVPNIRRVQSGEIDTIVRSSLYGSKVNQSLGDGTEFHQLQDFTPGMNVKSIDWKRSARRRSLVAKDMHAERNHNVILCMDTGYLMQQDVAGLSRLDHAVTAALATAWAAAVGGDRVGYFSYDVRPNHLETPGPGRRSFARMRSWSAELFPEPRETNHTLAMSMLNARTPKRSLIVVFTDFIDTTSAELLLDTLAVLARRHLIVFVAIRDPDLDRLVASSPKTMDMAAQIVSAHQSLAERRLVIERLNRLGVTVIDARPGTITTRLISTYLEIKTRELI